MCWTGSAPWSNWFASDTLAFKYSWSVKSYVKFTTFSSNSIPVIFPAFLIILKFNLQFSYYGINQVIDDVSNKLLLHLGFTTVLESFNIILWQRNKILCLHWLTGNTWLHIWHHLGWHVGEVSSHLWLLSLELLIWISLRSLIRVAALHLVVHVLLIWHWHGHGTTLHLSSTSHVVVSAATSTAVGVSSSSSIVIIVLLHSVATITLILLSTNIHHSIGLIHLLSILSTVLLLTLHLVIWTFVIRSKRLIL
jgi:hypothetical protein